MIEVVWSDAAFEQLQDIVFHIQQFDPIAARLIANRMHALANSLSIFPNRGRPGIEHDTREMTTVPPYVMTYEVTGDLVAILDIRHGRQTPRRLRP